MESSAKEIVLRDQISEKKVSYDGSCKETNETDI